MPHKRKPNKSYVNVSRADRAMLGTHVPGRAGNSIPRNSRMDLGNKRKARRATRGTIDHVVPHTSTRESRQAYARRSRRVGFVIQEANRQRRRNTLALLAAIALGLLVAFFVARAAFTANVNSHILLKDDAVAGVLAAPENDTDPYYTLLAGEYSDSRQGYDGPNLLVLVRVDPANHVVTLLDIPGNTEVVLSDNDYHAISEAQVLDGDAGLISAVGSLMGVDIAHYAKTDADGFVDIVDSLGGVDVDVPEEVDDPDAGDIYISAGQQTLDGQQALTLCRADNYSNPVDVRTSNQMAVLDSLLGKVVSRTGLGAARSLDSIKADFKTDMNVKELNSLLGEFDTSGSITVHSDRIPGSLSVETDGVYFVSSSSALQSMMASVNESGDPGTTVAYTIEPSSFTIEVRNGAGIDGGASQVQGQLAASGFKVTETGNADNYVYDETLVVYKDDSMIPAANEVISALGVGRAVDADIYYTFDTDILVVIGKDWKPLN